MNGKFRLDRKYLESPARLFCLTATVFAMLIFLAFLFTHGDLLEKYYWDDIRDTGMDFFHSIEYVRGGDPYGQYNTLYPPLANLFFFVIYRLIPYKVSFRWLDTFDESLWSRGTNIDLRTYQAPMLCFIIVIVIAVWMLTSLIAELLKDQPCMRINWVTLCLLLSPGMVYAFERGNILFLLTPLVLFYVQNRNSSNLVVKELALLSIAVAAGMKIYPAFLGILLIRDKRYKEALRAVVYGIASVFLPIMFFNEGFKNLGIWLKVVFDHSSGGNAPWLGYTLSSFLHNCAWLISWYLKVELSTDWFFVANLVVTIALLLVALLNKTEWQSTMTIIMAMFMFSSQGIYSHSLVCIPLIFFLVEEKHITKKNIIGFILIMLYTVNIPVFNIDTGGGLRWDIIARQLINIMTACWCIVEPLMNWRSKNA